MLFRVALLSRMMRTVAVTGRTDSIDGWCVDRQTGRWAQQTIGGGVPVGPARLPAHAARRPRVVPRRPG